MKSDIGTENDVKRLVDSFYDRVNADRSLGPIFNEVAHVDWSHHLPTMYSFWSSLLLGSKSYHGQPFPKHAALPKLSREHFGRWIELFTQTVTDLFEGPVSEHALYRANLIATIFQSKLGLLAPVPLPIVAPLEQSE